MLTNPNLSVKVKVIRIAFSNHHRPLPLESFKEARKSNTSKIEVLILCKEVLKRFEPGLANPKTHPKNPPKKTRVFQIKKPTDKRVFLGFFIQLTILQRFSTY